MDSGCRHNPEKLDTGHFLSEKQHFLLDKTIWIGYNDSIFSSQDGLVDWRQH